MAPGPGRASFICKRTHFGHKWQSGTCTENRCFHPLMLKLNEQLAFHCCFSRTLRQDCWWLHLLPGTTATVPACVYTHTPKNEDIYIYLKINNIPFALDQGAYRCPRSISFTPDALEKNRMLKWIWRFTVRWLNWYCAARAQPIWMSRTCSAEGSVPVSLTALPLSICFTDRKVSEDIRILRTRLHLQYRVSDTASEQRGAKPETQKYSSFLMQGKQTTKNKCL